jgi:CheY-like chemotaxis protein
MGYTVELKPEAQMKTILIADDEPNLRLLVSTTLGDPSVRVLEARDGSEALRLAREELPDVLILDWMMPGMTGVEVAGQLREDPVTAGIPVVLLTAKAQETDKEQGRRVGVKAYLVKPFSPLELLQVVDDILGM